MNLNKEIDNIITLQYNKNKNANIGDVCKCPICGRLFTKATKTQAFCVMDNHACKNSYHNFKRYGTKLPEYSIAYGIINECDVKRNNDEFGIINEYDVKRNNDEFLI